MFRCTKCRTKYIKLLLFLFGLPIFIILINFFNHVNVYEYTMQKPFRDFKFPLEIEMRKVIDQVLSNEYPGVEPINYKWYPSVFNNRLFCKTSAGEDEDIFLLFIVKSSVSDFKLRQAVRQTWGNAKLSPNVKIRTLFLLGYNDSNPHFQEEVKKEQTIYKDIEQNMFIDSYDNNTIKTMMGFRWASSNCLNAHFVVFMEDDYYLNVQRLLKVLNSIEPYQRKDLLMGSIWNHVMPMRRKSSKKYISLTEYPYRYWPPYLAGGLYIVTPETLQKMHISMQYTRYLRFDDVFLGIVACKLGISPVHVDGIHFHKNTKDHTILNDAVAMHGFSDPEELIAIWTEQLEYKNLHKIG